MKVVHISSSDSGGAGIAARRLNDALNNVGIDSKLLCVHKSTSSKNIEQYRIPLGAKILTHTHFPIGQNKYLNSLSKYECEYEAVSFPEAFFDISDNELVKNADVINLHWVGSILNYKRFFSHVKQPIVWTLHDMNPFLGIAHYMGDLNKNVGFKHIEDKVLRMKYQAVSRHERIHVVTLCDWMRQYSTCSRVFYSRPHSTIPNSINTDIFNRRDKQACRKALNLSPEDKIILFCAQSIHNHRKGFDLLLSALKRIPSNTVLAIIGAADNLKLPSDLKHVIFGSVNNELLLSIIYSASDLFVLPSREDNLPNTMVEALCCGAPVVAFSNGGMRDVIEDNISGILVREQSAEALAKAINQVLFSTSTFNNQGISDKARELFHPVRQANEYISLYQSLL